MEGTGTDQPLRGWVCRKGTVIIDGFGLPEYYRHEWGIWVTELAGGPATEPDKRLAPWLHGVPAWGIMQHWVLTRYLFATD